jgi:hypothetical protein
VASVRIKLVLAAGLVAAVIGNFASLLHAPRLVVATNGVQAMTKLTLASDGERICQAGETLPSGTSAIDLTLEAVTGPLVNVEVLAGRALITSGTRGTAWYGTEVTVPVKPLRHGYSHATVCFRLHDLTGVVPVRGQNTAPKLAATASASTLPGRFGVSYLRNGNSSWLAQAGSVITHVGFGRAASGSWIVFPIVALMLAAIAFGCYLIVRELT